ncbi:MAG TPA: hypothetical protein VLW55_14455 [Burkholderiaceae bacterium]|nr:hypothetical protein [Burkholderiaceae bacterium]
MDTDIRLVAKIYRAIREFSTSAAIDEAKCERIAQLIRASEFPAQIEALVEQHADCIQAMSADDFVASLRERVVCENQIARLKRETAALV